MILILGLLADDDCKASLISLSLSTSKGSTPLLVFLLISCESASKSVSFLAFFILDSTYSLAFFASTSLVNLYKTSTLVSLVYSPLLLLGLVVVIAASLYSASINSCTLSPL